MEVSEKVSTVRQKESDDPLFMVFVWVDIDRRYFISTTSSLADGGEAYSSLKIKMLFPREWS
jgi:hypothetical protein